MVMDNHRTSQTSAKCETPPRNLRQSEVHPIHTYSLLNLSPIFVIINHDGEFVYLDLD